MALLSLQVSQFRNMAALAVTAHPEFNLIYGKNGSGKTSLLEAIYYLAHGRSFRSRVHQRLIKDDAAHFTLHAKVSNNQQSYSLGLQRSRTAELLLRLNGANVQRLAEFASLLPVQLLTPDSFRLFFGGPKERRQFFDMGVFHVEPGFFPVWLQFSRVLKQRNSLLKQRRRYDDQFAYWDQQFASLAWQLQGQRQLYIDQLTQAYQLLVAGNELLTDITMQLQSGWPERINSEQALLALLQQNFEQDCRQGFTQYGPQKADLKLKKAQLTVEEVLSRGQLKVLLFALKIAQNNVISNSGNKQPLLLIDDLASELDSSSTQLVFEYLTQINSQVFITAINADQVSPYIAAERSKMFHVEHGQITARTDKDGRTT
ncbi:DNA replication and repair protein RecF [Arsukibacterium tuosuense]|uniref:DNA replication and repair protein RecF n=1 Tax=Arsukibacterium tuosuense TaxID=1323745 RepID=A0A285ILT2_9GAMM|nr:DNA replication/repair protein RecF [Arsukibacterium tuosuense]SNY48932.1 DNA replication and repair protein RecF [Arsukibacterium tuosuense]